MDNSDILILKIIKRNDEIQRLKLEVKLLSDALVAEVKLRQLEG